MLRNHDGESCDRRGTKIAGICKKNSIHVRLSLIFPLILVRFACGLNQIPRKVTEKCPSYEIFGQRSGLKVIDKQTYFFLQSVYTGGLYFLFLYVSCITL